MDYSNKDIEKQLLINNIARNIKDLEDLLGLRVASVTCEGCGNKEDELVVHFLHIQKKEQNNGRNS